MNMNNSIGSSNVRPEEMLVIRAWIDLLTNLKVRSTNSPVQEPVRHSSDAPFSFTCGARTSREWLKRENAECESSGWDDGKRIHLLRWSDPETSL